MSKMILSHELASMSGQLSASIAPQLPLQTATVLHRMATDIKVLARLASAMEQELAIFRTGEEGQKVLKVLEEEATAKLYDLGLRDPKPSAKVIHLQGRKPRGKEPPKGGAA